MSQSSLGLTVTITHPFHPFFQQSVEVVRIRRGIDPDLIIRLPDGTCMAVAASLTTYHPGSEPVAEITSLPLLDLAGLVWMVHFLEQRQPPLPNVSQPSSAASPVGVDAHPTDGATP